SFTLPLRVGDGRRVGAAVRLGLSRDLLYDLHLCQIDDADGVVARVRRVELLELWHVLDTFGAGRVANRCDDLVSRETDDVGLSRAQMRGEQIAIIRIN